MKNKDERIVPSASIQDYNAVMRIYLFYKRSLPYSRSYVYSGSQKSLPLIVLLARMYLTNPQLYSPVLLTPSVYKYAREQIYDV